MRHKYRVNLGLRTSARSPWSAAEKQKLESTVLSAYDSVRYAGATALISTNDPDAVLDALLEHGYTIEAGGPLRWINASKAEDAA